MSRILQFRCLRMRTILFSQDESNLLTKLKISFDEDRDPGAQLNHLIQRWESSKEIFFHLYNKKSSGYFPSMVVMY